MSTLISSLVLVLSLLRCSFGIFIDIDANERHCFHELVTQGSKLGLVFEVVDGGFLDVDIKITGPDYREVYNGVRESSGKYTFAAHMDGEYTYCFSNEMSTMTPKLIMFSMDVVDPTQAPTGTGGETDEASKLDGMVKELATALKSVKREQSYMEVRERVHRSISDSTNSRVVQWAVFEAFVLVAMSIGQVYYLKRFFEVRRFV